MLSAVMEDYIKAIYSIQEKADERVGTSELADYLDVTSPTVSSMLNTLEERGLVDREEYRGVTLTEEGEVVALEILRHHRLLEAFLTERLDYDWADVHEEADRLEHHVSEQLTERIAETLDNPGVDPHGDPIPDADLELPESDGTSRLSMAEEGETVEVRRIHHQGDEELRYLAGAGIEPGVEIEIVERAPVGLVTVRTPEGEQGLPEELAGLIETAEATEAEA